MAPEGLAQGRVVAALGLVHPFLSLLAGLVVAVVALIAGGGAVHALVLGVSMALLQASVGGLGDLVLVALERREGRAIGPGRRRPAAPRGVTALAGAAALGGLLLAVLAGGVVLLVLGAVVLVIGASYRAFARGTPLSWLPVALGVPLLPVFGWYGIAHGLPGAFATLVPAAALGGGALAIASEIADAERDAVAGAASLAVRLGPRAAALVVLALQVAVGWLAVATGGAGGAGGWHVAVTAAAIVPAGGALLGVLLARRGRSAREVAFEVQAVGLALLAVAWVNAVSATAGA